MKATNQFDRKIRSVLAAAMLAMTVATASPAGVLQAQAAVNYASIFDATFYAAQYPDVVAAVGNKPEALLNHYAKNGVKEGRQPSAEFNVNIYKSNYADLQSAFGNDPQKYADHYVTTGKAEHRVADHLLQAGNAANGGLNNRSGAGNAAKTASTAAGQTTQTATAQPAAEDNSWQLMLVNNYHELDTAYVPPVSTVTGDKQLRTDIVPIVQQLMKDAEAAGAPLTLVSAYRSADRQTYLFNRKVKYYLGRGLSQADAEVTAQTVVERPGHSEHQTGLSMDITDRSYTGLTTKQETTKGYQWLYAHAADYGFILRYPKNKEDVTKVIYEPWHFRYVGQEAAQAIMSQGITLEEYLGQP